jgi:hypothetical protein
VPSPDNPRNLRDVSVARGLERRLESLFEGSSKRVFSGRIHPVELAEKIAREADLARFEHISGPATANLYLIKLNPRDIEGDLTELQGLLQDALDEHAADVGLRLEGPPTVRIEAIDSIPAGQISCEHRIVPGALQPWAKLVGEETHMIQPNRAILGRSDDADVRLEAEDVSRSHALISRSHNRIWVRDMGSANGTWVDGQPVANHDVRLERGALITLASNSYRFLEI